MTTAPWSRRLPPVSVSAAPVPALFSVLAVQQFDMIVSIVLALAAIGIAGALVVAFWRELRNDTIVIAPIAVSHDLRGLAEGIALHALGRHKEALANFIEAAACDPNDPAPRAAAAELLAQLGRDDEAAARRKEAGDLAARNAAYE
jgi:Flp pilus assembly protein TadD